MSKAENPSNVYLIVIIFKLLLSIPTVFPLFDFGMYS